MSIGQVARARPVRRHGGDARCRARLPYLSGPDQPAALCGVRVCSLGVNPKRPVLTRRSGAVGRASQKPVLNRTLPVDSDYAVGVGFVKVTELAELLGPSERSATQLRAAAFSLAWESVCRAKRQIHLVPQLRTPSCPTTRGGLDVTVRVKSPD